MNVSIQNSTALQTSPTSMKNGCAMVKQHLSEGKLVFVTFHASWCPACREFLPKLSELSKMIAQNDTLKREVVVVTVESNDLDTFFKECPQFQKVRTEIKFWPTIGIMSMNDDFKIYKPAGFFVRDPRDPEVMLQYLHKEVKSIKVQSPKTNGVKPLSVGGGVKPHMSMSKKSLSGKSSVKVKATTNASVKASAKTSFRPASAKLASAKPASAKPTSMKASAKASPRSMSQKSVSSK